MLPPYLMLTVFFKLEVVVIPMIIHFLDSPVLGLLFFLSRLFLQPHFAFFLSQFSFQKLKCIFAKYNCHTDFLLELKHYLN